VQLDSWYDLMVLELSDLTDAVTDRFRQREAAASLRPDTDTAGAGESGTQAG